MGLLTHGLAVGLGYMLGRPEGRQRLAEAGRQAAELRNHPKVTQLTEQGKDVAAGKAKAVTHKVKSRVRPSHFPPSADTTPTTPLAGTTVVEDSEAAVLGTTATPRPDLAGTDLTAPDLAASDLDASDLATPDLAGPDLTQPELTKPDRARPESARPLHERP